MPYQLDSYLCKHWLLQTGDPLGDSGLYKRILDLNEQLIANVKKEKTDPKWNHLR